MYTNNNIKNAEKSLKHELMADFSAKKPPVARPQNYQVVDNGLDTDMKDSLKDLELTEKTYGYWSLGGKFQSQGGLNHTNAT